MRFVLILLFVLLFLPNELLAGCSPYDLWHKPPNIVPYLAQQNDTNLLFIILQEDNRAVEGCGYRFLKTRVDGTDIARSVMLPDLEKVRNLSPDIKRYAGLWHHRSYRWEETPDRYLLIKPYKDDLFYVRGEMHLQDVFSKDTDHIPEYFSAICKSDPKNPMYTISLSGSPDQYDFCQSGWVGKEPNPDPDSSDFRLFIYLMGKYVFVVHSGSFVGADPDGYFQGVYQRTSTGRRK